MDKKEELLSAYRRWNAGLAAAGIPQKYWAIPRDVIAVSAIGNTDVVDFIYDRPDIWTRGHVILIDGDQFRHQAGMACLVAAMSYIAVSDDFSSPEIMCVDSGKLTASDANCREASVLLITEMKGADSAGVIDDIMRSRKDSGKTTIITFADGCSQCLREGKCGLEIGRLLSKMHKNLSILNEERKIIRIGTV